MTTETKKTWVTKYGFPESRMEIEHASGCPACAAAGPLESGDVIFIIVEGSSDGPEAVVRRVEGVGRLFGLTVLSCRIVSREEADREIAEFEPTQPTSTRDAGVGVGATIRGLFDVGRMILDPAYAAYSAAKMGAHAGKVYATHDPCLGCGHGRLLHRRQAYRDAEPRARDEALSETRCRHGQHAGDSPCGCERWSGVETKVPDFNEIMKRGDRP